MNLIVSLNVALRGRLNQHPSYSKKQSKVDSLLNQISNNYLWVRQNGSIHTMDFVKNINFIISYLNETDSYKKSNQ